MPQLSTKTKVIIVVIGLVSSFAVGRFSAQKPTVKTQINQQTEANKVEDKNTHTKTTITETKQPNGVDTTTTVIDQVSNDYTKENKDTQTQIQQTVTPPKVNTLNLSILGANDFSKGVILPTYGLSVTKQVLGPFTAGAFGLMNGTVGISVGVNF